jgi:hypothetical protein
LAGKVCINGKPVESGSLTFLPKNATRGPAVGAPIVAGQYDCPHVPLGEIVVQVYAVEPTGKTVMAMGKKSAELKNIVPLDARAGIAMQVSGDNRQNDIALFDK